MDGNALRIDGILLTDEDARWVDNQVASGRFPNAASVLADAVRARRKDEEDETALHAALGGLVDEAAKEDARGDYIDVHTPEDFDRAFGHLRESAGTR